MKTTIVIADTTQGLKEGLDEVFAPFGGVGQALGSRGGTLYVKPNTVHFSPHTLLGRFHPQGAVRGGSHQSLKSSWPICR